MLTSTLYERWSRGKAAVPGPDAVELWLFDEIADCGEPAGGAVKLADFATASAAGVHARRYAGYYAERYGGDWLVVLDRRGRLLFRWPAGVPELEPAA